jgi:signal transduction histidine kinase
MPDAKVSILLVDDEPRNLTALVAVLEGLGHRLVLARSGKEALRCLIREDFALVLLDVLMPDMDGFETAALIRSRPRSRDVPIIFLTAGGRTEAEQFRGYEVGAVDYILKPFIPEVLRSKVRVFEELYRKTEQLRELNATLESRVLERTHAAEERSAELARSNGELEQFAYAASHDLQEPLRTLSNTLQLLERRHRAELPPGAGAYVESAVRAAGRMRELIQALLEYSRMGQKDLEFGWLESSAVLSEVLEGLKEAIREKEALVTVGDLPRVRANQALLTQIFQNLVQNALKYCRGRRPEVLVEAEAREDEWLFRVRDNGIGIEAQYLERVFRIFQRLHSREEYPGVGMGLAVCRKAVEKHGGRIWCESEPGVGSTFLFTLPEPGLRPRTGDRVDQEQEAASNQALLSAS